MALQQPAAVLFFVLGMGGSNLFPEAEAFGIDSTYAHVQNYRNLCDVETYYHVGKEQEIFLFKFGKVFPQVQHDVVDF